MMAAAYKKCRVVCCITAEAAAAFPYQGEGVLNRELRALLKLFTWLLSEIVIYKCIRSNEKCSKHLRSPVIKIRKYNCQKAQAKNGNVIYQTTRKALESLFASGMSNHVGIC